MYTYISFENVECPVRRLTINLSKLYFRATASQKVKAFFMFLPWL